MNKSECERLLGKVVERGEKHYLKSELPSGESNKSVFTATIKLSLSMVTKIS